MSNFLLLTVMFVNAVSNKIAIQFVIIKQHSKICYLHYNNIGSLHTVISIQLYIHTSILCYQESTYRFKHIIAMYTNTF